MLNTACACLTATNQQVAGVVRALALPAHQGSSYLRPHMQNFDLGSCG
jgi:hypothetical protein